MIDLRCEECRKLLLRAEIRSGRIEITCLRCKTKNTYCFSPGYGRKLGLFGREAPKPTLIIS